MQNLQTNKMENTKEELINLIVRSSESGSRLLSDLIDGGFNLMSFEQDRAELLSEFEIYLANNKQMNQEVKGLKEMIDCLRKFDDKVLIVNSLEKEDGRALIVYTDSNYSTILGMI